MKKNLLICILISLIAMLALPGLAVMLARGESGMAIMFILFYAIDPISAVIIGLLSGSYARKLWPMPILNGLLFWLGTAMLFGSNDPSFPVYGALYAFVGLIATGLFHLYKKHGSAS